MSNELKAEIKRLNAELEYFKDRALEVLAMGDTILDGVLIVHKDGKLIGANGIFESMFDIEPGKVVGRHYAKFHPSITAVAKSVLEHEAPLTHLMELYDGAKQLIVTGAPFYSQSGHFLHAIIVLRDMTELIKLQEELDASEQVRKKIFNENEQLKRQVLETEILGNSKSMLRIKEVIREISSSDASILITGDTGTGKEIISKEIHKNSHRRDNPYVKINCAAIPENLLESELFGYEKGAFTGAGPKEKPGLFEIADTGTILLDEIGELPLSLQSKLLRVIQEKELLRVGGVHPIKLDVRIISATNQDLTDLMKQGKFRQDLYYRLNVVPLRVPPLRERRDDISLLSANFLKKFNTQYKKYKHLDIEAVKALEGHQWPGNIRELQNIIERLVLFGDNRVIQDKHVRQVLARTEDISPGVGLAGSRTLKEMVAQYEKGILEATLRQLKSTHKAAKALGVTQPTVLRKAKRLGIQNWKD